MARRKKEKTRQQELLEELIDRGGRPRALKGPEGLLNQLTRSLVNTAIAAEPSPLEPKGQERTDRAGRAWPGPDRGPRDRDGSLSPTLIPKHSRQFAGFDDKIISVYARGMTVREISGHFEEVCGVEVSPDLTSRVTDAVVGDQGHFIIEAEQPQASYFWPLDLRLARTGWRALR
jgi:putative transposase